jgi:hypothetical protein
MVGNDVDGKVSRGCRSDMHGFHDKLRVIELCWSTLGLGHVWQGTCGVLELILAIWFIGTCRQYTFEGTWSIAGQLHSRIQSM